MKSTFAVGVVVLGVLLSAGCATKKYVQQNSDPIKSKLDQVADLANKQGQTLDQTRKQLETDETTLNSTTETAKSADTRSTDALNKATAAGQKVDQTAQSLAELRDSVGNLDNYKMADKVVVLFGFNKDTLTKQDKADLDKVASDISPLKHYVITVAGYADRVGPADYNNQLSRRRADRVVHYLVAQHNIPVYRMQMVGLGKDNPAAEGHGRSVNAKNRRVEVTIYSSEATAAATQNPSGATDNTQTNTQGTQTQAAPPDNTQQQGNTQATPPDNTQQQGNTQATPPDNTQQQATPPDNNNPPQSNNPPQPQL